jgi:hypothetical protein
MADQLKARVAQPSGDVALAPGEVVVEADHLLPCLHQTVDKVRTHKPGSTSDQVAHGGRRVQIS